MFDYFWFEPEKYFFNRCVKDIKPYYTVEKDGKLIVALNVLGVAKEDISVEVKPSENTTRQLLVVSGKTHNDLIDKDYNVNMEFLVKPLHEVSWDTENGMMIMELEFETPVKPIVSIVKK